MKKLSILFVFILLLKSNINAQMVVGNNRSTFGFGVTGNAYFVSNSFVRSIKIREVPPRSGFNLDMIYAMARTNFNLEFGLSYFSMGYKYKAFSEFDDKYYPPKTLKEYSNIRFSGIGIPIGFCKKFSPYKTSTFASFAFVPALLTAQTHQQQVFFPTGGKTINLYENKKEYSGMLMNIRIHYGLEHDVSFTTSIRFSLSAQYTNIASSNPNLRSSLFSIGLQSMAVIKL